MKLKNEWARMPSRWIQQDGLKPFSIRECGVSIAALKIYIIITFKYHSERKTRKEDGLKIPYDFFSDTAYISRPLINPAIVKLQKLNLITCNKNQRGNIYTIFNYEEPGWAKFPIHQWSEKDIFSHIGTRQHNDLYILKLYLAILAFMHNNTPYTHLAYDSIEKHTHIPRKHIKRTINQLLHLQLVECFRPESYFRRRDNNNQNPREGSNTYRVLGLPKERQEEEHLDINSSNINLNLNDLMDLAKDM